MAERVRGKSRLDLSMDPPPNLVIEIDITSSSIEKLPIYALLGVPEVSTPLPGTELYEDSLAESPELGETFIRTHRDVQRDRLLGGTRDALAGPSPA